MIKGIINYSHHLLECCVTKGDTVIDATCGNGHDTLFLSELVGPEGHVISFDIQQQAIGNTQKKMTEHNIHNVELVHDNHAHVANHLTAAHMNGIGGAIFNLGYLPGSDKSIITNASSTLISLDTILGFLKPKGVIVLVVYYGHDGGRSEKDALLKHVIQLDQKKYNVLKYGFINQKNNPPFIIAVQRKS